jgi:hypothetical protein
MSIQSLDKVELTDTIVRRLLSRAASTFRHIGEDACRSHIGVILTALEQDLGSGKREAVRGAMQTVIEELSAHGLTFADLRFLVQTLRSSLRVPVESASEDLRALVDDWFFELVMVSSMRFIVAR